MSSISNQSYELPEFQFSRSGRGPGPRTHNWDKLCDGTVQEVVSMGNASKQTFIALLSRAAKKRGKKVRTQMDRDHAVEVEAAERDGQSIIVVIKGGNKEVVNGKEFQLARVGHKVEAPGGIFQVTEADHSGFAYEALGEAEVPEPGSTLNRLGCLIIQAYTPGAGQADGDQTEEEEVAGDEPAQESDPKPKGKGKRRK